MNLQVTCALDSLVLGILCISKTELFLNFMPPNFHSTFWLKRGLVSNMVHSRSIMVFILLDLPSTCGISVYYNDGMMSFVVVLWPIFPPPWTYLVLASPCC